MAKVSRRAGPPLLCLIIWWHCVEIQVFLSTRPLQGYQAMDWTCTSTGLNWRCRKQLNLRAVDLVQKRG
eukprot:s109_g27.t1